ncbi:MAG: hypothetical protein KIT51_07795 [Cyclobacteriaceae bacterium]|nr:MAG: hypothetical protein KIT51_07795 [Cyclobacteriaceae bacterium]
MERESNGRFAPGHNGFKPKGSGNKIQGVARQKLGLFLESHIEQLPEIFKKLSNKEKARLIMDVVQYFLPKQREITHDLADVLTVDYSLLDGETLDKVLNATHNG